MTTNTIIAQCTPSGSGAIALLRVSGPEAVEISSRCALLSSQKKLINVPTHTIHHGWVTSESNEKLDQVMFFVMHAPRTFTGENVVEITTHNNPFIIESIIERLIQCGARLAQRGEFSRQAVLNNKLDLVQAEAINDLVHANSQQLLKQSLEQLHGTLSHWIADLETDLIKLLALCEASFEFLEEDIDFSDQMRNSLNTILEKIDSVKGSFDQQERLRQGVRIAIVGSVNAGKSSLFNALIGKKRAIVTNIAGTTRDVIEAGIYQDGLYWTFIDTAGLRKTDDVVEKEGIERAYEEAKLADIVLLVFDGSTTLSKSEVEVYESILNQYANKTIKIRNKSDLPQQKNSLHDNAYEISTASQDGIEKVKVTVQKRVKELFTNHSSPFLLNKRHFTLLINLETELKAIQPMLDGPIEYELVAHHLKQAIEQLTELTGKSVNDKMFETVFKNFCVGK